MVRASGIIEAATAIGQNVKAQQRADQMQRELAAGDPLLTSAVAASIDSFVQSNALQQVLAAEVSRHLNTTTGIVAMTPTSAEKAPIHRLEVSIGNIQAEGNFANAEVHCASISKRGFFSKATYDHTGIPRQQTGKHRHSTNGQPV